MVLVWLNKDGAFEMKNVPAEAFRLEIARRGTTLLDYFVKSVIVGGPDMADSGFFCRSGYETGRGVQCEWGDD
jgi:hypothetical protein